MAKSLVSFIRKSFRLKGRSDHNGRGSWEMYTQDDVSYDEIVAMLEARLDDWSNEGIIEDSDINDNVVIIEFSDDEFDPNYRKFIVQRSWFEHKPRHGVRFGGVTFSPS